MLEPLSKTDPVAFLQGDTIMESRQPYAPQPGDVFACWGADPLSRAISLETSSLFGPSGMRFGPSHVAIACPRWFPHDHRVCYWWESTTLASEPCLEAGHIVSGCQVHEIEARIREYASGGGCVSVYRLTRFDALTATETRQLRNLLGETVGCSGDTPRDPVTYDTAGALCSGTRLIRRFTLWHNQLEELFCSELLAAVLQRLGRLCRQNPSSFTPAKLLRRLLTEGTYQLYVTFNS